MAAPSWKVKNGCHLAILNQIDPEFNQISSLHSGSILDGFVNENFSGNPVYKQDCLLRSESFGSGRIK